MVLAGGFVHAVTYCSGRMFPVRTSTVFCNSQFISWFNLTNHFKYYNILLPSLLGYDQPDNISDENVLTVSGYISAA